ncbi:hypothetical protein [Caulobacter sp. UNC279MFTsu5.1]|uniref:hypothetical protein n=1 Tax=Caulobacter sp. UNC279MFTsu5.1 TaxID=1502775 RepID=UPI0003650FF4|nr:hypothetical protein [Caulobacter sp. UNC279MFTsu5.1]SFK72909.1 hypothetical protein SAMN02799626_05021 [Caulobacter sp. UNC279MFTsu5.1]
MADSLVLLIIVATIGLIGLLARFSVRLVGPRLTVMTSVALVGLMGLVIAVVVVTAAPSQNASKVRPPGLQTSPCATEAPGPACDAAERRRSPQASSEQPAKAPPRPQASTLN